MNIGRPYLRVKRHAKTSHIEWSDGTLDWRRACALARHFDAAGTTTAIRAEFAAARARLPARSTLGIGGASGSWTFCPNEVAARVVALLEAAQGGVEILPAEPAQTGLGPSRAKCRNGTGGLSP